MKTAKKIAWVMFGVGIFWIIILLLIPDKNDPSVVEQESSTVQQQPMSSKELIGVGRVDTKGEWITPFIDYPFEFKADNHEFNIQFTSKRGGWTKKILILKNENLENIVPGDAAPGPVKITAGENESSPFEVRLYKK
jgi:hypothetical protein